MAAVREVPRDSWLYRTALRVPLLGGLLWTAQGRHSVGPSPLDPAAHAAAGGGKEPAFGRYFRSPSTGLLLFRRTWDVPADVPLRGVVYLSHGYGEHCGRYDRLGAVLSRRGFRVEALDHQGHGQSEGDRAFFPRFANLVEDVLHFAQAARPAPEGVPRFLFGHSMGALIALHTMRAAPAGLFTGLVLSGPALVFDPRMDTPFNRFLVSALSDLVPKLQVQPLDVNTLNTDRAVILQYGAKRGPAPCAPGAAGPAWPAQPR